ncbi:hypothetical protein ACH4UY_22790 [Streptomyces longwoodensis]|uniref:hypothetical protein n=1 Tax=Streptomyces longwoodensis TaxID=68231 RepID=UPI0037A0A33D
MDGSRTVAGRGGLVGGWVVPAPAGGAPEGGPGVPAHSGGVEWWQRRQQEVAA